MPRIVIATRQAEKSLFRFLGITTQRLRKRGRQMANVIIDSELLIDLLETEWGYEGIREDVTKLLEENGTFITDEQQECKLCR